MQVSNQLPISQDRSFLMYSEVEKEFNISFLAVVRQEQLQNDTFQCKISAHWSCFQFIILSWEHKQGPTYPPARSLLSDHLFRASSALQLYPAPERYLHNQHCLCISLMCTSTMVLFSELFSPLSSARHFGFFLIFFPLKKVLLLQTALASLKTETSLSAFPSPVQNWIGGHLNFKVYKPKYDLQIEKN